MVWLSFFPTPYHDEILYSVLCRYHLRSGNPSAAATMKELWGTIAPVKSIYLPRAIDAITQKIPSNIDFTSDKLILEHTMYPYVQFSLSETRAKELYEMMCKQTALSFGTDQKAGMSKRKVPSPLYLRYCPSCVTNDISLYGETYWHRIHQLPGIFICPEHGEPIVDSPVSVKMIRWNFYPASEETFYDTVYCHNYGYTSDMVDKLVTLAKDTVWLLENGGKFGFKDEVVDKYHSVLQSKNLMNSGGRMDHQRIYEELNLFFGRDFLNLIHSDGDNIHLHWSTKITGKAAKTVQSIHHSLMMRFLCGSPQTFLESENSWEPFGKAPWPCHNKICPHYLEDVIPHIDIIYCHGVHKAMFTCPYCGFSYRRGRAMPKKKQYEGHVKVASYGHLWEDMLKDCLVDKNITIEKTSRMLKCSKSTVRKYAAKFQLIPGLKVPKRRTQLSKPKKQPESRNSRRTKLENLLRENPGISRIELKRLDSKTYQWLRANDSEWFGSIAPSQMKRRIDWAARDEEYLKKTKNVIPIILHESEIPRRISVYAIFNYAGIDKKIIYINRDKLPKTVDFLEKNIETKDDWRRRKIIWAIEKLKELEKPLSITAVSNVCRISYKMINKHRNYILDCIEKEKNR